MALPKIQYRRTASGKWQRKALSSGKWYYVAESAVPREEKQAQAADENEREEEEEEEDEEVAETARERAKREAAQRRREREEMRRREREEKKRTEREAADERARAEAQRRRMRKEASAEIARINADIRAYYATRRSSGARIYNTATAARVAWDQYLTDPDRWPRPPRYRPIYDEEPSSSSSSQQSPPRSSPSRPPPPSTKKKAPDAALQDELDEIVAKARRSNDVAGKNRFFRELSRVVHPDKCKLAVDVTRDPTNRKVFDALDVNADIERFYSAFHPYVAALGDPERDAFCGDMQKRLLAVRS